jgi:hypothetical protein
MSLLEKLNDPTITGVKTYCKVGQILEESSLSEKDKQTLIYYLDMTINNPNRLTNTAIARALRSEGFDISNSSVDRHRSKQCPCYRKVS